MRADCGVIVSGLEAMRRHAFFSSGRDTCARKVSACREWALTGASRLKTPDTLTRSPIRRLAHSPLRFSFPRRLNRLGIQGPAPEAIGARVTSSTISDGYGERSAGIAFVQFLYVLCGGRWHTHDLRLLKVLGSR